MEYNGLHNVESNPCFNNTVKNTCLIVWRGTNFSKYVNSCFVVNRTYYYCSTYS